MGASGGGLTPISLSTMVSGSSSSRRRAPGARCNSARNHVGRARLGSRPVSDRLRHRASSPRARHQRCCGKRRLPSRDARRSVPARRYKWSRRRPCARSRQLRSFATFSDPDGNGWLLQEITTRLPGRVDTAATLSASDLASALRVRPPLTACTSSASARQIRTGPTGTPSIWCASRPARICRYERSRPFRYRRQRAAHHRERYGCRS